MIIRVVSASGTKRVLIDKNEKIEELKRIIEEKFEIPILKQKLSRSPLHDPNFLEGNYEISHYGLTHGSQIWLVLDHNIISKMNKINTLKRCSKIKIVNLGDEDFQKTLNSYNNLIKPPKHLPFNFWIKNKRDEYKKQPWNIPNTEFDFRAILQDGKKIGYKNLPSNAILSKQQEYRHIDEIFFEDVDMINRFKLSWLKNPQIQRAALLFGTFEKTKKKIYVKEKLNEVNIIRIHVYGLWEYPQDGPEATKSVRKLMKKKRKILDSMGFQSVGMIVTTQERKDKKGDQIFMTGIELIQACKFQHFFKNKKNFAQFVTVIMHEDANKEPDAFMISDKGLAMVRDGLCEADPKNPSYLRVKKSNKMCYQPAVIFQGKIVNSGENIQLEIMLVQIIASIPKKAVSKFQFIDVYSYCDEHNIFPAIPDVKILTTLLRDPERNILPLHVRLSDFLLALHLADFIDENLACEVVKSIIERKTLMSIINSEAEAAFDIYR